MKRYLFVLAIATFMLAGCRSSKEASKERANNEVWQTLLVKQLDATIEDQIITVKYNNGTTLCYKILDKHLDHHQSSCGHWFCPMSG